MTVIIDYNLYYNSETGVWVFVCLFVVLLLLQLWVDYIQTCYIGSAGPQLMYWGVLSLLVVFDRGRGLGGESKFSR